MKLLEVKEIRNSEKEKKKKTTKKIPKKKIFEEKKKRRSCRDGEWSGLELMGALGCLLWS